MFTTRLNNNRVNDARVRIPRRRRHHLMGGVSHGSSRPLRIEALEQRVLLTAYVVNTLDDNPAAGPTYTDQLVSLREAIMAVNTNAPFGDAPAGQGGGIVDTITFDESLSGSPIVLGGQELAVTDHLSLTGLEAANLTISGNLASRVFSIAAGVAVEISSVTIANGQSPPNPSDRGGGIYSQGMLTVKSTTFTGNKAGVGAGGIGGAIYADYVSPSTLEISNTTFTDNKAGVAGAIYAGAPFKIADSHFEGNFASRFGGAILSITGTVSNCTFLHNRADGAFGGAIDNRVNLKIVDSTFSGNSTGGSGGAIMNSNATLVIVNSTLSENSARKSGGGIAHQDWDHSGDTFAIVNSTISGNSAGDSGGGILSQGAITITNATVVGNRADSNGDGWGDAGGIFVVSHATVLNNTIVAGNVLGKPKSDSANDISGEANVDPASSHNLIGDAATAGGLTHGVGGNIVGNAGSGTMDVTTVLDPNLVDNGGPTLTHALVPHGPAFDAGDNSKAVDADDNPLLHDQRGDGFDRVSAGIVDIGALEVQVQAVPVQIDVKFGSDPNSINLAGKGVIAVTLFTDGDFDASLVDLSTVVFAGAHAVQSALEDADRDGDLDMVLHFRVQDTNLVDIYAQLLADDINEDGVLDSNHQTAAVSLMGWTATDEYFAGFDDVDLFLSGKKLRDFLEDLAARGLI